MPEREGSPREAWLTASEVGRYAYCARAWWLQRVCGWAPRRRAALERGVRRHEEHVALARQASVAASWTRRWLVAALLLAAALVLSVVLSGR